MWWPTVQRTFGIREAPLKLLLDVTPSGTISAARVALSPGTARPSLGPGGEAYHRGARRWCSVPSYLVSSALAILNRDDRRAAKNGGSIGSSSSDMSGDWSPRRE